MRKRIRIVAFLSCVSVGVSASPRQDPPSTRCGGELGRELTGYIIPGVPLLAGIRSGMSKDEVRRLAPRLSLFESGQRLELFPGLSFRATALFRNYVDGEIEYIRLSGSWRETPIEALTVHYGKPITLDTAHWGRDRVRVLKWCDGKRVFILTDRADSFGLIVTAERFHR
jgi:hypothetical protein